MGYQVDYRGGGRVEGLGVSWGLPGFLEALQALSFPLQDLTFWVHPAEGFGFTRLWFKAYDLGSTKRGPNHCRCHCEVCFRYPIR